MTAFFWQRDVISNTETGHQFLPSVVLAPVVGVGWELRGETQQCKSEDCTLHLTTVLTHRPRRLREDIQPSSKSFPEQTWQLSAALLGRGAVFVRGLGEGESVDPLSECEQSRPHPADTTPLQEAGISTLRDKNEMARCHWDSLRRSVLVEGKIPLPHSLTNISTFNGARVFRTDRRGGGGKYATVSVRSSKVDKKRRRRCRIT